MKKIITQVLLSILLATPTINSVTVNTDVRVSIYDINAQGIYGNPTPHR